MAKCDIQVGSTSQTREVFIQDTTKTNGGGLTGLAYNTSGLTAYYALPRTASTAMTLATLAAITSAFSSGGFKEIDATNMPGWYRFDIPDAALASGSRVVVHFRGAANMAETPLEINLTATNNQDSVRFGLTALPNAAAEAAGGLYTRGTGAGQINQDANGRIDANAKAWIGGTIPSVNVTGVPLVDAKYLLGTVLATPATAGIIDVNVKNMNNVAGTAITTIKAVQGLTTADTIATYTGNTPQTGDAYARIGAPAGASASADIAAIKSDTGTTLNDINVGAGAIYTRIGAPAGASIAADIAAVQAKTVNLPAAPASTTNITAGTITTVTNLTNAPTAGDLTATMKTSVQVAADAAVSANTAVITLSGQGTAIKAKTDNLPGSPAAVSDIPSAATIAAAVWASVIEGSITAVQVMRGFASGILAKCSGLDTTTAKFRNLGDTKDRITATVDTNGNRSSVTLDLS